MNILSDSLQNERVLKQRSVVLLHSGSFGWAVISITNSLRTNAGCDTQPLAAQGWLHYSQQPGSSQNPRQNLRSANSGILTEALHSNPVC